MSKPLSRVNKSAHFVTDRLRRALAEATASAAWFRLGECRHYFCKAAVPAQAGIPRVVFGPGDIARAQTVDEWIAIAQRERVRAMGLRFRKSLP